VSHRYCRRIPMCFIFAHASITQICDFTVGILSILRGVRDDLAFVANLRLRPREMRTRRVTIDWRVLQLRGNRTFGKSSRISYESDYHYTMHACFILNQTSSLFDYSCFSFSQNNTNRHNHFKAWYLTFDGVSHICVLVKG